MQNQQTLNPNGFGNALSPVLFRYKVQLKVNEVRLKK